jgi:hypothetical protein
MESTNADANTKSKIEQHTSIYNRMIPELHAQKHGTMKQAG